MLNDLTHFIDGKHIKGTSGRFSDVFTPMTGEIGARVPLASAAEVRAAVENAKAAQPAWAATNPQHRARVLMKFIDLLNRDLDSLSLSSRPGARQNGSRREGRNPARPHSWSLNIGYARRWRKNSLRWTS